jgi:Reverse transcriptase (RNA-dependent DNA polymerase)
MQLVYDQFFIIVKHFVDACIPVKTVRLGRRNPDFINPHIKALLPKRNSFRRQGFNLAADKLATDINACIANNLKRLLSKLSTASVNEMWSALKRDNNGSVSDGRTRHLLANPETVNQYIAGISFDATFNSDLLANLCNTVSPINSCDSSISIYEVDALLQSHQNGTRGDRVPYWVFRLCAVELAEIFTYIYNTSLQTGCLPRQWLTAIITPIPKIQTPNTLADFRPISVTPILSRIIEKIIVRRWIIPAINQNTVVDQFAFRPSGSTTCALVYLMHHVTSLLENNSYVRCLMIDFSKAFERVNPLILAHKLRQFPIPDYILKSNG